MILWTVLYASPSDIFPTHYLRSVTQGQKERKAQGYLQAASFAKQRGKDRREAAATAKEDIKSGVGG